MKYLILLLSACCTTQRIKIIKAGPCTRYNICDVTYSDGTTGIKHSPIIGETVEIKVCK